MEAYRVILFTFNSNNNLVKLVLLIVAGFLAYTIFLQMANPSVTVFQNQATKNYSVAENYIYNHTIPKVAIIGSSLSSRLIEGQFDEDVYNLSLGGGSVLTALNIIKVSNRIPHTIFIESNVAYKELDKDMISNLFVPIIWKIRGFIKSLQYTYQPINILLTAVKKAYESSHPEHLNDSPDKKILQAGLDRFIQENNSPIGPLGKNNLNELKNSINYFKDKGTNIVFFEMPVHPFILSSRKYLELRSDLQVLFPESVFYWVDSSVAENFITSDGVHLMHNSAVKFSELLSGLIKKEIKVLQ